MNRLMGSKMRRGGETHVSPEWLLLAHGERVIHGVVLRLRSSLFRWTELEKLLGKSQETSQKRFAKAEQVFDLLESYSA